MTDTTVRHGDAELLRAELGRPLRGVRAVMRRCADGHPTVVETEPRLPDGTPFPTLYYLTCPNAIAGVSTLESRGVMTEMTTRLHDDAELAAAYMRAHETYLAERENIAHVPEIAHVTAGGMPARVKCLHVLVAHSLARGPGANVFGDEALDLLDWSPETCDWTPGFDAGGHGADGDDPGGGAAA